MIIFPFISTWSTLCSWRKHLGLYKLNLASNSSRTIQPLQLTSASLLVHLDLIVCRDAEQGEVMVAGDGHSGRPLGSKLQTRHKDTVSFSQVIQPLEKKIFLYGLNIFINYPTRNLIQRILNNIYIMKNPVCLIIYMNNWSDIIFTTNNVIWTNNWMFF